MAHCFAGCYSGSAIELIAKVENIDRFLALSKFLSGVCFSFSDIVPMHFVDITTSVGWELALNNEYLQSRNFTNDSVILWKIEYNNIIRCLRIPVFTESNEHMGFVYRTLPSIFSMPKYLYSSGFAKKSVLFGINLIQKPLCVVLVEGCFDAIWLHQNHIAALAILGNHLSSEQFYKLLTISPIVKLCFDNDLAGNRATEQAFVLFKENSMQVSIVNLPKKYKDIQEVPANELLGVLYGN